MKNCEGNPGMERPQLSQHLWFLMKKMDPVFGPEAEKKYILSFSYLWTLGTYASYKVGPQKQLFK